MAGMLSFSSKHIPKNVLRLTSKILDKNTKQVSYILEISLWIITLRGVGIVFSINIYSVVNIS